MTVAVGLGLVWGGVCEICRYAGDARKSLGGEIFMVVGFWC
ncbi:MAG: hypothetical protein Q6367_013705 [Candidatus Freyarchaeota archaeon]